MEIINKLTELGYKEVKLLIENNKQVIFGKTKDNKAYFKFHYDGGNVSEYIKNLNKEVCKYEI